MHYIYIQYVHNSYQATHSFLLKKNHGTLTVMTFDHLTLYHKITNNFYHDYHSKVSYNSQQYSQIQIVKMISDHVDMHVIKGLTNLFT